MKLFKLSQTANDNWDTFDSCIVCAENEEDAKTIAPNGKTVSLENWSISDWVLDLSLITCEEIGTANENIQRGVICASFNAG